MILFCFHMILHGFYMILYYFYMIVFGFHMILYGFYLVLPNCPTGHRPRALGNRESWANWALGES